MSNITKSYTQCTLNEAESSPIYKLLTEKSDKAFESDCWYINESVLKKLQTLIDPTLTAESCLHFFRPIVRAKQLAGVIASIDIQARKKVCQKLIRAARTIQKDLVNQAHEPDTIRLFMEATEIDYNKLSLTLDEYILHLQFLCDLKFKNGETLNPNNLRRFGIHCIFHVAETAGLSKEGKPSQLYQFVQIVTDLDYKTISEYYASYKNVDVIAEAQSSIALRFIYNPSL